MTVDFAIELLIEAGRLIERALYTKSPKRNDELLAVADREKARAVAGLQRLAASQGSDRWQPIASAPKDGSAFLAATKFLGMPTVERIWWDGGAGGWQGAQGEQRFDAWMALPTPPGSHDQ